VAGFERRISSVSIMSGGFRFDTVAKVPKTLGCSPAIVNTVFEPARPVNKQGIGVMLE
jgi:hypothetical protein